MSYSLALENLCMETRQKIVKDITVSKIIKFSGNCYTKPFYPYLLDEKFIYLPLYYTINTYNQNLHIESKYPEMNKQFCGKLRPIQKDIKKKAIKILNKQNSVVIAAYTGCGKTITSIYIACKIKLKTLIVISRVILIDQWIESIQKFVGDAKIQKLTSKSKLDEDADFYIINAINVPKHPHSFYKNIGTLIVDEVHLIATKVLSKSLAYILPKYNIALSATPTRSDGMDTLIHLYFGKEIIYKKLNKKHIVYKVDTKFKPDFELNQAGKVDWDSVLRSQAGDTKRNELIIDIVKHYKSRVFLILCKRVVQAKYLNERFKEENIDSLCLVGGKKYVKTNARVLTATIQKCGTGFDNPRLDSLILAGDVQEYFIQYLGRVMRRQDVIPYIFDLVDNNGILKRHYYTRRKIYLEHGGVFKKFELN